MSATRSIRNDPALLRTMMADMEDADPLFQPTSFWRHHEARTVAWLLRGDLNRFRESGGGLSRAFGALHYASPPYPPERVRALEAQDGRLGVRVARRLLGPLARRTDLAELVNPQTSLALLRRLRKTTETLQELTYYCAELLDRDGTLGRIQDSGLGNPSDRFEVDGRTYTYGFLKRFSEYAYVKERVDFGALARVLEIGSGYGGQVELLLQAHPHLRACIVDIPPQLYVANQYLEACFPGEVYGYRSARADERLDAAVFDHHRVVCLAPWQLPRVDGVTFDLFWNSSSFQEMEPEVVENYARHIQKLVSTWLYLMNKPEGTRLAGGGKHGVQRAVTLEHYRLFFSEFDLVDRRPARAIPRVQVSRVYDQMLFRRRGGPLG